MVSEVSAPISGSGGSSREEDHIKVQDFVLSILGEKDRATDKAFAAQERAVDAAFAAQEKAVDAAFAAQEKAVNAALVAQEKAISAALDAANTATNKSEINDQRWRENANEWRTAMNDREGKFVMRNEYLTAVKSLEDKLEAEVKSFETQLKSKNIQIIASFSFGLLATLIAVFNVATRLAGG